MKIPPDFLVQLGQVGTLVLGSLGVWVALINQRRQLNAQMFIEVTGRFQELLRLFPTEAWLANRIPSQPLPPASPGIDRLHIVLPLTDIRGLSASQGPIHYQEALAALGARNQAHSNGPGFAKRMDTISCRVCSQPRLPSVHKQADGLYAATVSPLIGGLCDPLAVEFLPDSTGAV